MTEEKQSRSVIVKTPQGFHARPADMFVRTAMRFTSKIEVFKKSGTKVDGKSMLSVLTLNAPQGTELTIEAAGPDAIEALEALVGLIERDFPESTRVE